MAGGLRARRPEIEEALMTRVSRVGDPQESSDPEYSGGLREAIGAALGYGIDALESEPGTAPIPAAILEQSRVAARTGIGVESVLRQCSAGYNVFNTFVLEEAARAGLHGTVEFGRLVQAAGVELERLLGAISDEHGNELRERREAPDSQRLERIERLLDGEMVDVSRLHYEFNAFHIGAISVGKHARAAIDVLSRGLACELLLVRRGETVWAWFGAGEEVEPETVGNLLAERWPPRLPLALGEPAHGIGGWRLSHRQARAAFAVALNGPEPVVRYAEVALLASALQDDLLTESLRQLYLAPLEHERDGGEVLRQTLRAYFDAGRNISAAAAALGANRNTVANRLRAVETRIGRSINACATELESALRLSELRQSAA
ncbi:MAG TPA: helix-turn-helix domain-containing protein [Solirubrobacterales bacterium]